MHSKKPKEPRKGTYLHTLLRVLREANGPISTNEMEPKLEKIDPNYPSWMIIYYISNLRSKGYEIRTVHVGLKDDPTVYQLLE